MANESGVVLSFHDSLLRQSDIQLLNEPHWLNDTIISFYFEYLEKVKFSEAKELLFVSPEVTQCIKMVQTDDIKTFLNPLNVSEKDFLFFPLNDNDVPDEAGGSHWSLLVYSRLERKLFHYDSSYDCNHKSASEFSAHLIPYLSTGGDINFDEKKCTQQKNGYDCGVHVIFNAERLAQYAHNNSVIGSANLKVDVNASVKRKVIINIINKLCQSK